MRGRALLVATGRYSDPQLRRLAAPAADAAGLKAVLSDPLRGDFEVTECLDAPYPTLRERIGRFFSAASPDELLLLYISGHGVKDRFGKLYFAAADTFLKDLLATGIPASFVHDAVNESRSRRVVLILDTCFSGAFPRGMQIRDGSGAINTADYFPKSAGRGLAVITAADAIQYALEAGGESIAGVAEPSVFSGRLIRGLVTGEADLDGDGRVTLDELFQYVATEVQGQAESQRPQLWCFGLDGTLVIAANPQPRAGQLSQEIIDLVRSPAARARLVAVDDLESLLAGDSPSLALAAREALEQLRQDPDRRVSRAAAAVLLDAKTADAAASAFSAPEVGPAVSKRPGFNLPPSMRKDLRSWILGFVAVAAVSLGWWGWHTSSQSPSVHSPGEPSQPHPSTASGAAQVQSASAVVQNMQKTPFPMSLSSSAAASAPATEQARQTSATRRTEDGEHPGMFPRAEQKSNRNRTAPRSATGPPSGTRQSPNQDMRGPGSAVASSPLTGEPTTAEAMTERGLNYEHGANGFQRNYTAAVHWYTLAAEQGNAEAEGHLGHMYLRGVGGLLQNAAEAVHWFTKGADQGNADAEAHLGTMYARGAGGLAHNDLEAVRWFTKAAEQGSADAEVDLGAMYESGRGGLRQSAVEATRWYTKAAEQFTRGAEQVDGHAEAGLGVMYAHGRGGLVQNDVEAVRWFNKAAEQGFPGAQDGLGSMYASGRGGLAQNDVEAVRWYTRAAEQGIAEGEADLAVMYREGRGGLAQNRAEARRLDMKAAEQGLAFAENDLGASYMNGRDGLTQSDVEAVRWYSKAAEQGLPRAQANLGFMYASGRGGLSQNDVEAVRWYTKAAEQGDSEGENNLAVMYARGLGGLRRNETEAIRLWKSAARQGVPNAQHALRSRGLSWNK